MKKERVKQAAFGFMNRGGKRRGAGRKPKGEVALVSHAKRAMHASRLPLHVTLKLEKGLPSLRQTSPYRIVRRALSVATDRFGCRVVHYSVQSNHLHLIVEAEDNRSLARGMNGLAVRVARTLNKLWGRVGRVFADRFHAHVLETPREVRNALRYVLRNTEKHGVAYIGGPDPFTSGESFDGWRNSPNLADSRATLFGRARTWLLRVGWRRHGLLGWLESVPRRAVAH